ncbi:MAG TPA: 2TM domain-containing protein [Leptolyngbyaceae cyanobacterium M65_K2018_010]|nr:2TM domain-containing protein [Leptolyngbyaceae cyanobacterium M65_K2018_010]
MPPRWPRQPTRQDPAYRRLEDRMNFAVHGAALIAVNSGLWFLHRLNPAWVSWVPWFTLVWVAGFIGHGVYIFAIADYSPKALSPLSDSADQGDA